MIEMIKRLFAPRQKVDDWSLEAVTGGRAKQDRMKLKNVLDDCIFARTLPSCTF